MERVRANKKWMILLIVLIAAVAIGALFLILREDGNAITKAEPKAISVKEEKVPSTEKKDATAETKKDTKKDEGNKSAETPKDESSKFAETVTETAETYEGASSSETYTGAGAQTSQTHTPVWVVDKAAWREEVRTPLYRETYWVYYNDKSTVIFYSSHEAYTHYLQDPDAASWGNGEWELYDYEVTYIDHPEEGHWE